MKIKLLVVVYGCLSRSLTITHKNHQQKIFNILNENLIQYKTCYVNNRVNCIDGKNVNEDFKELISPDYFVEFNQSLIDSYVIELYPNYKKFFRKPPDHPIDYIKKNGLNPYRNSFIETQVSEFALSKETQYTHCLAFCADNWFDKDFPLNWINNGSVIVSDQNPADGYTNGLYLGKLNLVAKLMNTFYNLKTDAVKDFEYLLKCNSERHKIDVVEKDFKFLKIRACGAPAYSNSSKLGKSLSYIINDYCPKYLN
jgi:hypothetical protein